MGARIGLFGFGGIECVVCVCVCVCVWVVGVGMHADVLRRRGDGF